MSSAIVIEATGRDRAATGIQLLDEKLGGGFPRNSILLMFSEIPAEKRIFAEHFVMVGVKANETCLYVDFYRAPQLARREFMKFGLDQQDKLLLVDATSSQLLLPSSERYMINDVGDLEIIIDVVIRAIREVKPRRIVIDSMEFLAQRFPRDKVLDFWQQIATEAGNVGSTLCFLFINWTYSSPELEDIRKMADYVIEFQSTISSGIIKNMMRIEDVKGDSLKTNWVPYTFKDLTGVTVYFPRILVTGPEGAGKSTVMRNLCNTSVLIDRVDATVAFDYGNVTTMGLEAELFSTPGRERFESIFKVFARELSGMILVVDASNPDDLHNARTMLDIVGPHLPCVILANKSDVQDHLTPDKIKESLSLKDNVPIVPSVASEGKGLMEALKSLAEMIIGVR